MVKTETKPLETALLKPDILLAENDPDLLDAFSLFLEEKYQIHSTSSVEGAFEVLKTNEIQVAVLDYKLDDGYSSEVLNLCRESGIKTILLSAKERDASADVKLMKPCDLDTLDDAIAYCLKK